MKDNSDSNGGNGGGICGALKRCFGRYRRTVVKTSLAALKLRIQASEPFRNLPDGNIEKMLDHVEVVEVSAGDAIVTEGQEGDCFYMVVNGIAEVLRAAGSSVKATVAELKEGDGFGEEALISCATRNATVRMKTDGSLLRFSKSDFNDYIREPMITWLARAEACRNVEAGSKWLDVRESIEDGSSRLRGALTIPLSKLRESVKQLDKSASYVCYCQNGRLSATAAFLLVQRGYKAAVLRGGLQGLTRSGMV